jgi:hypothetical protein
VLSLVVVIEVERSTNKALGGGVVGVEREESVEETTIDRSIDYDDDDDDANER